MQLRGGWKRMFAGLPLVMTQAQGPGHIAFSRDAPGEVVALPIQPGTAVDVREHMFMVATSRVQYDWFNTNVWFQTQDGDETETHYPLGMFMDRFSAASEPGLLLLHAAGNAFVRGLAQGETILVKPTALLFKDTTVGMQLHIEHPAGTWRSWRSWGERYMWVRLFSSGPRTASGRPRRCCPESAMPKASGSFRCGVVAVAIALAVLVALPISGWEGPFAC
jgi:uncharacterized protein (AIM24 family)